MVEVENTIFSKMKLKEGTSGIYLYAPVEYVEMAANQNIVDFSEREKYDFVHLFVESKQDYYDRIGEALSRWTEKGALWISYPKGDKKNKYDINRDILFSISAEHGIAPCSQVALDDKWSALRFKRI